jgi:CheY-like chemotaxis protein
MLKVLLLDDNSGNLFLNGRILKRLGCQVTEITDPVKALLLLNTIPDFDIAFVDLYMPVMNGLHFLERAKTVYPHLPVIMTSVLSNPNAEILALTKGASACMFDEQDEEDFENMLAQLFPQKWKLA